MTPDATARLQTLVETWRVSAEYLATTYPLPSASPSTLQDIFRLRQCADELEALLRDTGPMVPLAELEQWKTNSRENKLIAEENSRRADAAEEKLRLGDAAPQERVDNGPDPNCKNCRGTGECSNAQFRCPCRWRTVDRVAAQTAGEPLKQLIDTKIEKFKAWRDDWREHGRFRAATDITVEDLKEIRIALAALPDGTARRPLSEGAELILAERERQIMKEGWTDSHDNEHESGEMGQAAICYIDHAAPNDWESHPKWPWEPTWWKPSEDPIRDLVKAGALIAAEIDRLQRASVADGAARREAGPTGNG